MNTRQQGDIGEGSAIEWFTSRGFAVATPIGHSPDWDLVIDWGQGVYRVQVKTSTCVTPKGRWAVAVCTRGGNQSWNGIVKHFSAARCDYLFAHVGDGRRWFIPATAVQGRNAICLGGPKYAEYEIEMGRPIRDRPSVDLAA